jgi:predicted phage terminase large subunit-like protein
VEFPELKRQVITQAQAWAPSSILVEDSASGQSLIQELRTTNLPILPIKPDSDKVSRAQAVTPLIESGRVFIPQSAGWLPDFLDELAAFPNAAHDDQVDSLTQALNYLRLNSGPYPIHGVPRQTLSGIQGESAHSQPFPEAELTKDARLLFSGGVFNKVL